MNFRNPRHLRALALIAGLVLLAAYPLAVTNPYYARIGGLVLLSAISASAWNIVCGYAGQASVGHAMFYGAGAYLPLMLYNNWQLPPTLGVPLGIAAAVLLAVLVGFPTFPCHNADSDTAHGRVPLRRGART